MTGMEHAIEQVAQVAASAMDGYSEGASHIDDYRIIARALADAGLIAPSPLAREWAVELADPWGELRYDRRPTREAAEDARWSEGNDRLVYRWVTAWGPADGIDRSESGGKAATSG